MGWMLQKGRWNERSMSNYLVMTSVQYRHETLSSCLDKLHEQVYITAINVFINVISSRGINR